MKSSKLAVVFVSLVALVAGCSKSPENAPPANAPAAAPKPLVEKQAIADWCVEHGVPESLCTRCNSSLIAGFKAKGDWCDKHSLPDSQCIPCHPELKDKFAAMAPKK